MYACMYVCVYVYKISISIRDSLEVKRKKNNKKVSIIKESEKSS